MDVSELVKRAKRALDGYISYRKAVLVVLVILVILLYCGPSIFRLVLNTKPSITDSASRSLSVRLDRFWQASQEDDAHILHVPANDDERPFIPYVGNGLMGLSLDQESPIYIRNGRTLSLPVNYRPITLMSVDGASVKEAIVTEYKTGVVHRLQSWEQPAVGSIDVTYQTYAHRAMPALLLQDIKIINPTSQDTLVDIEQMGLGDWLGATTETVKLQHGEGEHEYTIIKGFVEVPDSSNIIPVAVVTLKVPSSLEVKSHLSLTLHVVTAVNYTDPIPRKMYQSVKEAVAQSALTVLKRAVTGSIKKLRTEHSLIWNELWSSGFCISHSKAENAVNGDLINATLYHVLSQARAPLHEVMTTEEQRSSILRDIAYAEGCYGGHPTLQADRLWSPLDSVEAVNTVVAGMEVNDVTKCSPATKLDPLPAFTGSSNEDLLMKIEMNDHTANDSETTENTQEQERKEVQLPKLRPKKGRKIKIKRKKKMKGTGKVSASEMQMTEDFAFMRKRRQDLTLGAKVKVLEILDREPKIPQGKIASMFRVSQSQVSRIMKNKETILVQWNRFATPERKRCRVGKAGELEQKLLDWYKEARKDDLPISGPILMEKAKSIGVEMGIDFKPSAGWLGRWKDRNGVTLKVFKEKDGTPSITKVANHWRRYMFVKSTRDVPWQNVWVVDETVLTYNSVPDCMSQMISGGKDRMSVILACNLSGTERKPAAVVGSVQSLEYMSLPVFYYYHENAKINLECFSSWLREWDRELHLQKKKIVLILNKAKHHPENIHFLNISITHFPLETSKVLQPLQLGIISSFKALYRYQQLRLLLANSKAVEPTSNTNMFSHSSLLSSHSQSLSALDAIYLIYKAWKHVSPETIAKGAVKAGLSKDVDALKVNDVVGAPPGISHQDFQAFVVQDNDLCPIDQDDHEKSNSQTKNSSGPYNYSRVTNTNVSQNMASNQHTDCGTQYLPSLPKVPETVLACQVLRKYLQQQGGRLYDEFSKLEAAIQMNMIQQSYPDMKEEDVIDPFHDPSSVHSFHAHKQAESLKVGYLQKLHHALEQKSLQKELKKAAQVPVSSASDNTSVPTQEIRSDTLNQNIDVQRHNLSGQELMREDVLQQEIQLPVQRHALIHQVMMRQEYRQDVPVDRSRTTLYEMRPDNVSPLYRPVQPNGSNCQGENKNGNLSSIPTDLRAVPMTDPRAGVASHPPSHSNELPQDIRQPDGRLEHPGIPYYAVHNPLHQCICGSTECCS